MSDGLFNAVDLGSPSRSGFRLKHFEVYNWGTFSERVWRFTADGATSLLTGDIGSGKSTLVDALTTLLLPAHRIAYNKAAGAEAKERTLRSYVEGHYKSERVESTGTSRPVALRDHRSYSVILGVFGNDGTDETVTLAQVFHQRDRAGQPDRFFVTATKPLSITDDFTDFGSDLTDLRRRLRATGAEIATTFPDYARQMRRLLAIRSEQAMDLFHQTVSMKSVGNLNDFVRSHMLEPVDASDRVRAIITHFEDLTKAHDAVRRAKDQLAALDPLVATIDRHDDALARRDGLEQQRDAVRLFFAELRIDLLDQQIERDTSALAARAEAAEVVATELRSLQTRREQLLDERRGAGGDRLAELDRVEAESARQAEARRARRKRFTGHLVDSALDPVSDETEFRARRAEIQQAIASVASARTDRDAERSRLATERGALDKAAAETSAELRSLARRRSNLPASLVELREELCSELDVTTDELPFAGELLDVAPDHADWRGAAERVLSGFAQSLLVPQERYDAVSRWVNDRRLTYARRDGSRAGMRLIYERVAARRVPLHLERGSRLLLADTIDVAPGSFEAYLRDELARRAGHRCVDTLEQFQHEDRAVTRSGQVRSGARHEKDDRSRVDDPRTWVLGWSNDSKVAALTDEASRQQAALLAINDQWDALSAAATEAEVRAGALAKLEEYVDWSELDWEAAQAAGDAARNERTRLLSGSSALAEIERHLEETSSRIASAHEEHEAATKAVGRLETEIERAHGLRAADITLRDTQDATALDRARASYDPLRRRLGKALPASPEHCGDAAAGLTHDLTAAIERIGRELGGFITSMMAGMAEVRRRWPDAATEMDVDVDARHDYRAFRDRVADDDLPRFENEFKEQLNTNTIRELAQFATWLRRQADEIQGRVDRINDALGAIDYSPGRYLALVREPTVNQEIRDFRSDLRSATDDALAPDDDHYSEARFLEVQRIIERFRGREKHAEADKTWTRRVTDVRNWFTFSASERDKETDEEWEHYRDSDGKSGGQKEKLAYTILAASLAYQFGLEWGAKKSRDFRFAVIDEAFGRGSDASTRYALELFAKLGLQLLIVTPLQKVHVIEPYVSAIGFVDNPEGSYSRLQTLTIEELRERRNASGG